MLQVTSLNVDLRSRQQEIDTMRKELQDQVARAYAHEQESEDAVENLMEQLAIAQTVTAETKVLLQCCIDTHACLLSTGSSLPSMISLIAWFLSVRFAVKGLCADSMSQLCLRPTVYNEQVMLSSHIVGRTAVC